MGLFYRNNRKGGFMDEIRCDESSYLIWKWHPSGSQTGANNRENAIRWGSSLRVKEGEVAVLVYPQENGVYQDYIYGPFDRVIKTANLPVLADIIGLAYGGDTPFQAEIYFINLAGIIQIKFGVPFFDIFDPRFADFSVPVAVRGNIIFRIDAPEKFVQLHRLANFTLEDFQKQIKDAVSRYVKDIVASAPSTHNIPVIQIENKISQINDEIEYILRERLEENFGVMVSSVDISAIEIDKTSVEYEHLLAVSKGLVTEELKAKTSINIKYMQDKQKIETENLAETMRIQREEGQYAQHKQTQTVNIGAFQVEKQAEVSVAGANALGQMGANGAGNVNFGGGDGTGFNMAAMMASMAVGGAVGQNIAGAMNNMMGGMNQQTAPGTVPPPIPTVAYHVAINGQAAGPFDISALAQMAASGQLTADSLVWKNGMEQWAKAGTIDELQDMFITIPPIPEEQ